MGDQLGLLLIWNACDALSHDAPLSEVRLARLSFKQFWPLLGIVVHYFDWILYKGFWHESFNFLRWLIRNSDAVVDAKMVNLSFVIFIEFQVFGLEVSFPFGFEMVWGFKYFILEKVFKTGMDVIYDLVNFWRLRPIALGFLIEIDLF